MKRILIVFAVLAMAFASCNKDEGVGGSATVQGKVYKVVHNDDDYDLSADTMVAAKQDVFIVYGDDTYFGDDVETGSDGSYRFRYLTAGNYTVYAYQHNCGTSGTWNTPFSVFTKYMSDAGYSSTDETSP